MRNDKTLGSVNLTLMIIALLVGAAIGIAADRLLLPEKIVTEEMIKQRVLERFQTQLNLNETPTIARIINATALKAQDHVLYNKSSDGDYILITSKEAYLYDYRNNIIKDTIPVVVQPAIPDDLIPNLARKINITAQPQVMQITDAESLKQGQPKIYRNAKDGDFIIVFADNVVVYDYANDVIVDSFVVRQPSLPEDFLEKLGAHGLDIPQDASFSVISDVDILMQQNPSIYGSAKNNDFIIETGEMMIIYDYINDEVVAKFMKKDSSSS